MNQSKAANRGVTAADSQSPASADRRPVSLWRQVIGKFRESNLGLGSETTNDH